MVAMAREDAISLDEAWAAAQAAPARPKDPGPPPEVDPDAPFGRGEDGTPIARFGHTKDGKIRLRPGRGMHDDKARVAPATPVTPGKEVVAKGGKDKAVVPARSYAKEISDTIEVLWLGASTLGQVGANLPVVGQWLPTDKMHAQAALLLAHKAGLAGAIDLAAQHNARAQRLAQRLAGGDVNWALTAGLMVLPFIQQTAQIWTTKNPEKAKDEAELTASRQVSDLAQSNRNSFDQYFANLAGQISAQMTEDKPEESSEQVA